MTMNRNIQISANIRQVGVAALAITALLLPACTNVDRNVGGPTASTNVTTEEVANQTAELIGQNVTVRSEPGEKIGTSAFTIQDNTLFGNENILVLNASGAPIVLPEGDDPEVQVTGKVTRFVVADIERDYGLDLDPNLYVEYEGKPAIIAQSIALAPEPGEITNNPSRYYNQVLAVPGEVEEIVGPNAFTLDEDRIIGGQDLLVIIANPKNTINEDEKVVATGRLRQFVVADIEREYDLTWDLDLRRKLEVEYTNKPVLIADSVYPSAVPTAAR